MQPGAHRTNGTAERRGGVGIIDFFQIAQGDHLAIRLGKAVTARRRASMLSRWVKSASGSSFTANSREWDLFGIAVHNEVYPAALHQAQGLLAGDAEEVAV